MTFVPGSVEFRQHIQNKFPRGAFEPVSEWLKRINSELGLQPRSRLAKLYYDQGTDNARFTPTEYNSIFGHPSKPSENRLSASLKRQDENNRDLQELAELKKEIKNEILGQFGEALKQFASAMETMAG